MSQVLETCSIQVIWISIDFIINDFSSIIFSVIHLRSYSFPLVFSRRQIRHFLMGLVCIQYSSALDGMLDTTFNQK